jgi:asparagine synthase (glutamine-hydrolysing)
MCGIAGIYSFNHQVADYKNALKQASYYLIHRGPDASNIFFDDTIGLAHRRLTIIDLSQEANQPMHDESLRYTIIYNGEIFNFQELKKSLQQKGVSFFSNSDTEVLLKLLIHEGVNALNKLNGFFAFAFYDSHEKSLLLVRDRYGIKPLLYYMDDDKLIFASEMKALLSFSIPRVLDYDSLFEFLQFNYVPAPFTALKNINKLLPGNYILIKNNNYITKQYYSIPHPEILNKDDNLTYGALQKELVILMEDAVKMRLIADVPIGAFLSGGIDSSVVVALASRHTSHLNTFSIGYRDEPFFDETNYAQLVSKKFKTNHHVFSLTSGDLYDHLWEVLNHFDEPFADSSALPVYILSKKTKPFITAALSGDGADELFGGYNKHAAEYRVRQRLLTDSVLTSVSPLANYLPQSRQSKIGNKIRQMKRFTEGYKLNAKERYWRWCAITSEEEALSLMKAYTRNDYDCRKKEILRYMEEDGDINDVLYTDMQLVLPNDMLYKVDSMSMANSLEVRVPFLDYRVVNFAFSLPAEFKVSGKFKKKILQDTFRGILPEELYRRPKHGFEVPLLKWLQTELRSLIEEDLLNDKRIQEQGIFDPLTIRALKDKLFSYNPGDATARIWGLIVWQFWFKKIFE